jgi:glycosyltransferase involved in cell wall biosynthesis
LVSGLSHSSIIEEDAVEAARHLIGQSLAQAGGMAINRPCDYLRQGPGHRVLPKFRSLPAGRKLLRHYPHELMLPPLTGNANDFSFLIDAANYQGFTGPCPAMRVRLVTELRDVVDAAHLAQGLKSGGEVLRSCADVCIFAPAELHGTDLSMPADWYEGQPWNLPPERQSELFADGVDMVLFLPPEAVADPILIERVIRFGALSDRLCLVLTGSNPKAVAPTILGDQALMEQWQRMHTAFRKVESLAFAVRADRFRALGGFDPRFATAHFAARELAFRLYNEGCYFLPLSVLNGMKPHSTKGDNKADKALYEQLSSHPWDRKTEGRFESPKVSLYIPAYRAKRFLGRAIDSILSQDYEDLEVCVADDGSPDTTLRVLESYKDDPRVRWVSGPNGGIGHASNQAIALTRGIYIGQLDSDDQLTPGAVRRLAEYLDAHPQVGCAYGSCERIDADGEYLQDEYSWPRFSREKMMLTSIAHHFRMFRRQTWFRTEKFRTDIANAVDYDIFLKMSEISEFHHIDEVLYQRRWHGENTSNVNEGTQTRNTHVVQRRALERLGLDRYWDVYAPDPSKPREVSYHRTGDRVFFWPDYSWANPYQRLLYAKVAETTECMAGDIDAALAAAWTGGPRRITFHLHWLNKLLEGSETTEEAAERVRAFLMKLDQFQAAGGRLVWTIHNLVSHDFPFPEVEITLANGVLERADAVHLHSLASIPEIEAHYPLPAEKLKIAPHGAYVGAYPDFVTREQARAVLDIDDEDEVILFLGQIRPYKGLDTLLTAFRALLVERPRARLLLAGQGEVDNMLADAALTQTERDRISVFNRFVPDMELQVFFRAADCAVFPYRKILTSGSLLLAMSYGVPVLIPEVGMTRETLSDSDAGLLYDGSKHGPEPVLKGLRKMFDLFDSGHGPDMRQAARTRAAAAQWEDFSPILFGSAQ